VIIQCGRQIKTEEIELICETVKALDQKPVEGPDALLGCLLFSGAAKAITPRDKWIGWSPNERLRNQGFVVNNSRFLIFSWIKVRYLASHVLGKVVKALAQNMATAMEVSTGFVGDFCGPAI
jgi:hypothetical protein